MNAKIRASVLDNLIGKKPDESVCLTLHIATPLTTEEIAVLRVWSGRLLHECGNTAIVIIPAERVNDLAEWSSVLEVNWSPRIHRSANARVQGKRPEEEAAFNLRIFGHLGEDDHRSIAAMDGKLLLDTGLLATVVLPVGKLDELAALDSVIEVL